jgi:homoserine O-acetyltransferase
MHVIVRLARAWIGAALALAAATALAQGYPGQKEGSYVARDFKFNTGETMAELRLHYTTLGNPASEPVMLLHGTTGSGAGLLNANFGGQLFGPGQPLDAAQHFVILPDSIGHGKSSKPSDGLRAKFPRYNYEDMVRAQYLIATQALGIRHLRLILGNSMGGMQAWIWGVMYAEFADALVPMASMPTEMSSRNWMLRRLITDSIRNDPEWKNGDYAAQPKSAQFASVFFAIATNGGDQAWYRQAPTRAKADALLDARLKGPFRADANDTLYQWDSSRDYNPSPQLERIQAHVLAINSADDERNPPSLGVMERELKRVKHARLYLIPASDQTAGHGTTGQAKWWAHELATFLAGVPRPAK